MSANGLKVISPTVASDRLVNTFPQAYTASATPYLQTNFHPRIRTACANHQAGNADLRLSKVVIVGEVATGKTSLINRFCHNNFNRDYKATIGVDFEVERLSILGIPYKLQIWDTAGQERFKSISSAYFRGAHVFDLNDPPTLSRAAQWMEDACQSANTPLRFLVGNKRDLVADTRFEMLQESMVDTAKQLQAELWVCSAKSGENVKEFFFRLTTLAFEDTILKALATNTGDKPSAKIGSDLINISTKRQPEQESVLSSCISSCKS